jgi:medium-chain acyl-[acyl-carrier-protein] hydrolase
MEHLVEELEPALIPILDLPFALFGHSLGALIAFEIARSLRHNHALEPVHFFASGCAAPHLPLINSPVHNLPERDFISHLRRMEGTPTQVLEDVELMEFLLPLLRADFAVRETYRFVPDDSSVCPLTAIGGSEDREVAVDRVAAWCRHTLGAFTHVTLTGGHFFLNGPNPLLLDIIAAKLRGETKASS